MKNKINPMSNNKPIVSVVMPVFNAEHYVHKAIKSIFNQTLKNFEFIVVNDASKDKTAEVIRSYAKKDKRIRLINNDRNLKIAHSLNIGISAARTDLIARIDADDISHPERLEIQYDFLMNHPKVAIVGANISITDKNGKEIWKREYPATSGDLKKIMLRYSPFAHPAVMFRKRVFNEFLGYDPNMIPCEDLDLWFKIGAKYDLGSIPKTLLKYSLSTESTSHYDLRATELLGFKIKINAIKKLGFRPSIYDLIYNLLQFLSLWLTPSDSRIKLYNLLRTHGLI
jgi:glycosyltransferase involved in cell wall biosynthesis